MLWFAQYENKSIPYESLRAAARAWGLTGTFGRRVEPGVYMISGGAGTDVHFIRQDRLQSWSKFIAPDPEGGANV